MASFETAQFVTILITDMTRAHCIRVGHGQGATMPWAENNVPGYVFQIYAAASKKGNKRESLTRYEVTFYILSELRPSCALSGGIVQIFEASTIAGE